MACGATLFSRSSTLQRPGLWVPLLGLLRLPFPSHIAFPILRASRVFYFRVCSNRECNRGPRAAIAAIGGLSQRVCLSPLPTLVTPLLTTVKRARATRKRKRRGVWLMRCIQNCQSLAHSAVPNPVLRSRACLPEFTGGWHKVGLCKNAATELSPFAVPTE